MLKVKFILHTRCKLWSHWLYSMFPSPAPLWSTCGEVTTQKIIIHFFILFPVCYFLNLICKFILLELLFISSQLFFLNPDVFTKGSFIADTTTCPLTNNIIRTQSACLQIQVQVVCNVSASTIFTVFIV